MICLFIGGLDLINVNAETKDHLGLGVSKRHYITKEFVIKEGFEFQIKGPLNFMQN